MCCWKRGAEPNPSEEGFNRAAVVKNQKTDAALCDRAILKSLFPRAASPRCSSTKETSDFASFAAPSASAAGGGCGVLWQELHLPRVSGAERCAAGSASPVYRFGAGFIPFSPPRSARGPHRGATVPRRKTPLHPGFSAVLPNAPLPSCASPPLLLRAEPPLPQDAVLGSAPWGWRGPCVALLLCPPRLCLAPPAPPLSCASPPLPP